MAKLSLVLKITESSSSIESKIRTAILRRLSSRKVLESAQLRSTIEIKNLFRRKMSESPTYMALTSRSRLVGALGLEDPGGKINAIIEKWIASTTTSLRVIRSAGNYGVKGGFTIKMVRSNYAEVLKMAEAKQRATSFKKAKSNQSLLKWLEWLLLRGDEEIIIGYDVLYKATQYSRSGFGLMFQPKVMRSWSVPVEFSGVKDDNFVTQVIDSMQDDIMVIFIRSISRALSRV